MANIVSGFRVSKTLLKRITELSARLETVDEIAIISKVTRSVVTRMAILQGIKRYEQENKITGDCTSSTSGSSSGPTRCNKPKLQEDSVHISINLPGWLLDRAQAIAEILDQDEEMTQFGRVSRAHVLRLSLSEGAIILTRKYLPKTVATGIEGASGV